LPEISEDYFVERKRFYGGEVPQSPETPL